MGLVRNIRILGDFGDFYLAAGITKDIGSKIKISTMSGTSIVTRVFDAIYMPVRFGFMSNIPSSNVYVTSEISTTLHLSGKNYMSDLFAYSIGLLVRL